MRRPIVCMQIASRSVILIKQPRFPGCRECSLSETFTDLYFLVASYAAEAALPRSRGRDKRFVKPFCYSILRFRYPSYLRYHKSYRDNIPDSQQCLSNWSNRSLNHLLATTEFIVDCAPQMEYLWFLELFIYSFIRYCIPFLNPFATGGLSSTALPLNESLRQNSAPCARKIASSQSELLWRCFSKKKLSSKQSIYNFLTHSLLFIIWKQITLLLKVTTWVRARHPCAHALVQ